MPSKEELDVAVPPTELLDNSFSKAKGELASRGGLANRQLPSLKKTSSTASANSFVSSQPTKVPGPYIHFYLNLCFFCIVLTF